MGILIYLLKVNLAIMVFYLFYWICYRRDTFFTLRRYLLLTVCFISFVYPLFDISHWFRQNEVFNEVAVTYMQYLPEFTIVSQEVAAKSFPFENISMGIYIVIAGFFLIRLVIRLVKIIGFRIRCTPVEVNNRQGYRLNSQTSPFSFFNWIFINPDTYKPAEMHEILTHELVHVRQHHSIDILLSELMCTGCWFNPFAWMLRNEIHRNLEFLTDNQVVGSGIDSQSYQFHLLRLANNSSDLIIANQFKKSPLKERIIMLNKKQTSKIKLVTYTLLLPLAVIMLIAINAVSCVNKNQAGQEDMVEEQPVSSVENVETIPDSLAIRSVSPDSIFYVIVDEMPTFPGGDVARLRFLKETIRYPIVAQENGIQGRVICSFIISASGEISDIQIVRGVDPLLDEESIRVIGEMPRWNPGKLNGVAVPVKYTLPLAFRLQP